MMFLENWRYHQARVVNVKRNFWKRVLTKCLIYCPSDNLTYKFLQEVFLSSSI